MKFQELFETQQGEAPRTPSLSQGVFLKRQSEKRAHIYRQASSFESANELFSFGFHKVTDPHLRERWTACFFDLLVEIRDHQGQDQEPVDPGADQPGPGEDPPVAAEQPARASFEKPLKRRHTSIELD